MKKMRPIEIHEWRVVPWKAGGSRLHHLHRLHGNGGNGNFALKLMFYNDAYSVRKHINLKTRDEEEAIRKRDRIYRALEGRVIRDDELDRRVAG